jgi:CBS domain-containing protein
MLCREIMKGDVECVSPRGAAEDAARVVCEEDLGTVPVCDQSDLVPGTITDRDIAIRQVADGKPGMTAVEDVMTREVIACSPADNLRRAQELMAEHHESTARESRI